MNTDVFVPYLGLKEFKEYRKTLNSLAAETIGVLFLVLGTVHMRILLTNRVTQRYILVFTNTIIQRFYLIVIFNCYEKN